MSSRSRRRSSRTAVSSAIASSASFAERGQGRGGPGLGELLADDAPGEVVLVRSEAEVKLAVELRESAVRRRQVPLALLSAFLDGCETAFIRGHGVGHLADGLGEQHFGFLDAIKHRMQVGREDPGDSVD